MKATTIDYIFSGTAAMTLAGVSSFTTFRIDLYGDAANVTSGGGEYFNTASSATVLVGSSSGTLLGVSNEIVSNPAFLGGAAIFGQVQNASPFFVAEGLGGLGTYDLTTAFPLTGGPVSQTAGSVFFTSLGDLEFDGIETMNFQAITTPLPASISLFATGLAGLGLLGRRRKRKVLSNGA